MFCEKCGTKLDNASNFCGNCGNSTGKSGGKIVIHRVNSFVGCAVGFNIEINGRKLGKIANGETLTIDVPYGIHKVNFSYWCGSSNTVVEVTSEFPNVYVDIGIKMGLLTNKIEVFNIRKS